MFYNVQVLAPNLHMQLRVWEVNGIKRLPLKSKSPKPGPAAMSTPGAQQRQQQEQQQQQQQQQPQSNQQQLQQSDAKGNGTKKELHSTQGELRFFWPFLQPVCIESFVKIKSKSHILFPCILRCLPLSFFYGIFCYTAFLPIHCRHSPSTAYFRGPPPQVHPVTRTRFHEPTFLTCTGKVMAVMIRYYVVSPH
jgi:hypothetical protein